VSAVTAALAGAGMDSGEAEAKAWLFDQCGLALLSMRAGSEGLVRFYVPGRIELLGKHTDYAGGRSLLCAVERGICLIVAPREDRLVRVRDARRLDGEILTLDPRLGVAKRHGWRVHAATVVRRVARNFPDARRGADIAFASDLPPAAGLSSSSALITALFLALSHVNALESKARYQAAIPSPEALASYLGCIENGSAFGELAGDRGVGTFGGSQDHTAIVRSRAGMLLQAAFAPVRVEREVRWSSEHALVVATSGVRANKTGNARERYNRASLAVRELLSRWNAATGREDATLADAVATSPQAAERLRSLAEATSPKPADGEDAAGTVQPPFAPRELRDRLDQFLVEAGTLVASAADAYAAGHLTRFGALVDRSQEEAELRLGNQVPETMALARLARTQGALAASAFGAGFGGSVWALVPAESADAFAESWLAAYRTEYPGPGRAAQWFTTHPGPGAMRV
jgi:galactokinase